MSSSAKQGGFTLIEVIVMVTVTAVGLLSIMLVADQTVRTSDTNENRVAGANLAREGVELVRAARDSNWQALSEQEEIAPPANQLQAWNCYAAEGGESTVEVSTRKPDCATTSPNSPFGAVVGGGNPAGLNNYRTQPYLGNGVPSFTALGQAAATTKAGAYRLCQNANQIFVPSPTGGLERCGSGPTFYRRISVQRGKNLAGGQYNLLVKSYVTWADNPGGDILIEEYLTDWRK